MDLVHPRWKKAAKGTLVTAFIYLMGVFRTRSLSKVHSDSIEQTAQHKNRSTGNSNYIQKKYFHHEDGQLLEQDTQRCFGISIPQRRFKTHLVNTLNNLIQLHLP